MLRAQQPETTGPLRIIEGGHAKCLTVSTWSPGSSAQLGTHVPPPAKVVPASFVMTSGSFLYIDTWLNSFSALTDTDLVTDALARQLGHPSCRAPHVSRRKDHISRGSPLAFAVGCGALANTIRNRPEHFPERRDPQPAQSGIRRSVAPPHDAGTPHRRSLRDPAAQVRVPG